MKRGAMSDSQRKAFFAKQGAAGGATQPTQDAASGSTPRTPEQAVAMAQALRAENGPPPRFKSKGKP